MINPDTGEQIRCRVCRRVVLDEDLRVLTHCYDAQVHRSCEMRDLARQWCGLPGYWEYPDGAAWRYTMRSSFDVFLVTSDTKWWKKASAICADRRRIELMAGAYVGETFRRNRRLRGEWVRCDVSDCPVRSGCPCWRMRTASVPEPACYFKDFLKKEEENG
jgi:hypothetical protein